jgi:hypothetical protein
MAILIEAINVVVRLETLRERYPGGVEGFQNDCPNRSYCADESLARVGFLEPAEMEAFGDKLEEAGLNGMLEGNCHDFVIVDQVHGPIAPCDWFEWGRHSDGFHIGWLAGSEPSTVYVPQGWTVEDALNLDGLEARDTSRDRDGLEFIREGDEMDVYRDPESGQEVYMARRPAAAAPGQTSGDARASSPPHAGVSETDSLVGQAFALEEEQFRAREANDTAADEAIQAELSEKLLPRAEELITTSADSAAAHYAHGVVLRIFGRQDDAITAQARSLELAPDAVPALMEMTVCLGELNRANDAEPYAQRAVELDGSSATAWGNLAMVHILQGDRPKARLALDQALSIDPSDEKNREIDRRFEEFFV